MGKIIIVLLLFSGEVFARIEIQPQLLKHIQNFATNESAAKACLAGNPSPEPTVGCVQAYRYMFDLCKKRPDLRIDRRYEKDSRHFLTDACAYHDGLADHIAELFDIDRDNCAPGFETPADGFKTVKQNADILDESTIYYYGVRSCSTYQTYINLCSYIDGNLKDFMPKTYDKLPVVDLAANPQVSNCKPGSNGENATIYNFNQDLAKHARGGTVKNIYEPVIAEYRARKPASQLTLSACDDLRTSYKNLRCNFFEDEKNKPRSVVEAEEDRKDARAAQRSKNASSRGGSN